MVNVRIHQARVRALISSPTGPVFRRIDRYMTETLNLATVTCPVDDGLLRASGSKTVEARGLTVHGQVVFRTPYAVIVHEGRGPIEAKPGKVLAFKPKKHKGKRRTGKWAGWVFTTRVGPAAPQPWLYEALKRVVPWPVRRNHLR